VEGETQRVSFKKDERWAEQKKRNTGDSRKFWTKKKILLVTDVQVLQEERRKEAKKRGKRISKISGFASLERGK